MNSITPVLDRIGQWLTGAPLWVQTPLVMVVVLLICVPLAAVLLKIVNTAGNLVERATGGGDGGHAPTQLIPRSGEGTSAGVRVVSRSEPEIPGD
ncbi:hypothetical protein [Corynebacterium pygosceleis]|uniref:hypothetical protein n=1 Tax=Corynebacterium pygosceleis TaxID=2800406 RepID=UPI001903BCA3|nr:hypothetical protein [Corynebacterium pygosceleis]MCK7675099.1 hypothetical protein [Corynebacterium pygosceleis]MCL0120699.1 hypothetical protein [Corynebacterium pygosceleis]